MQLTNLGASPSDYQANHIIENSDQSCNPASNQCNTLRFYPYKTNYSEYGFGGGLMGLGDVTGDSFGDVAAAGSPAWVAPGRIYLYSGSQNGLQVAATAQLAASVHQRRLHALLLHAPDHRRALDSHQWFDRRLYLQGWQEAGDIDGDGKRDFLFASPYMNDPNGNAYLTGGFFLFH